MFQFKSPVYILGYLILILISCKNQENKIPNSLTKIRATISEELITLKTYAFSDPDPIARIGNIYPYFKFEGYTNHAIEKEWKMVVMENKYIKIFVCPEIGGKVWGAIEKSTGKEFLYFNHVAKFRNIAMRGPWTSGGLEFNFGDIGHAPSCSTPVDYKMIENQDGSVSCIVGAYDLPSRTRWNIDIRLPADKAYLETKVSWFNPTEQHTSYYQWMNAAAKASGNLEFFYPGKNYIGHNGEVGKWPAEKGRNISKYENNNFGNYKSYHVLNAYSDFFGGYWHDDDFGFGHVVPYDEKPGKKLWIWGLSQQGMIWEDLLTDSDGQYIEYQSGKLFNQASTGSTLSPFKHKEFGPYASDIFTELWFPLKNTKGMVAASKFGILNVMRSKDSLKVYLSALQNLDETLSLEIDGKITEFQINLNPLDLFETQIPIDPNVPFRIELGNHLLEYSTKDNDMSVDRPIELNKDFNWDSAYGHYTKAIELEKQRLYKASIEEYQKCLDQDPGFLPALNRLSLALYRKMDYSKSLELSLKALSIDTYDPETNFAYGLINNKLGKVLEAKSGFSISAQSNYLGSASYIELSKIALKEFDYQKALVYAGNSIEYNSNNIFAHMIIAYANRKSNNKQDAKSAINQIYKLDPLSDFARFEEFLLKAIDKNTFNTQIRNELPHESYLELASYYLEFGDIHAAINVLTDAPDHPISNLWLALLQNEKQDFYVEKALTASAQGVFPHRIETAEFIQTLLKSNQHWKLKYYLGLIYWHKDRVDDAVKLFKECRQEPDFPAFYLTLNNLVEGSESEQNALLLKAQRLDPKDWRTSLALSNHYLKNQEHVKAISLSEKMISSHPENSQLGMNYIRALIQDNQYQKALGFLDKFEVLPFEGSTEGKTLFTYSCTKLALQSYGKKDYLKAKYYAEKAKLWPVNLGVGKPYDTDDRIQEFIIANASEKLGNPSGYETLTKYVHPEGTAENANLILQLIAMKKIGKSQEANSLLASFLSQDADNQQLKWVKDHFNNTQFSNSNSKLYHFVNSDNFNLLIETLRISI